VARLHLGLLSGGRIVTAVTAGWMEGEFALLGADFERRGRLLDEWLDLAASVFEQMPGRVVYKGDFFSVDGWLAPGLVRPGGPELWVAGVSRATLRRAARTGIWHPVALPPDELRWPLSCAGDGRTAASSCASAFHSGPSPKRAAKAGPRRAGAGVRRARGRLATTTDALGSPSKGTSSNAAGGG
jgi:alkanesulfonate monooxygenase SsuD/methylene tetrahydromethanopterin reductase-like flavin-dependent oxidoreductase (luciferase family)